MCVHACVCFRFLCVVHRVLFDLCLSVSYCFCASMCSGWCMCGRRCFVFVVDVSGMLVVCVSVGVLCVYVLLDFLYVCSECVGFCVCVVLLFLLRVVFFCYHIVSRSVWVGCVIGVRFFVLCLFVLLSVL